MSAPERLYTNKNGTAIITPPAIPLHETDIEWLPAARIAELQAENRALFAKLAEAKAHAREMEGSAQAALAGWETEREARQAAEAERAAAWDALEPFSIMAGVLFAMNYELSDDVFSIKAKHGEVAMTFEAFLNAHAAARQKWGE